MLEGGSCPSGQGFDLLPPPKRKRSTTDLDSVASEVIDDIKKHAEQIKSLGGDIEEQATKLVERVGRALDDPRIDHDDLKDSWRTLLLLIESRATAATISKAHQEELDDLARRLEDRRSHMRKMRFTMQIGDWIHDIHDRVKHYEGTYADDCQKALQATLTQNGMPGALARQISKKEKDFRAVKGLRVSDTFDLIQPEVLNVKKWHADGRTGEPPATPYLDRVGGLCKRVGVNRKFYLDLLEIGDERNKTAHKAIPFFEDYRDEDGKLDWVKVKTACHLRKRALRSQFKKGKLTDTQFQLFKETIDCWFKAYVSEWAEDGTPILAEGAKEAVDQVKKRHDKQHRPDPNNAPDSPYEEGKWDDIV
ncbi:hypothetical protein ACHAPI_008139 [Fusarium lateritium]